MACAKYYNGYPSYECYKIMKHQFGKKLEDKNYSINTEISNFGNKYEADVGQKLNTLSDVFTNLQKYLSNGAVFASPDIYNGEGTCKYISYLLCSQISENAYGECDKDTFNLLKDFVDEYHKITHSNMCKNILKPLNNDDFKNMKVLYQLYDKFIDLMPYTQHVPDKYCQNVLHLFSLYNNFLSENPSGNLEFNNILTQFEPLIEFITRIAKDKCTKDRFIRGTPSLYKKIEEQIPSPPNETLGLESKPSPEDRLDGALNRNHLKLTSSSTTLVEQQERAYHENSQRYQVSDPLELSATSASQETDERRLPHQNMEHSEPYESFRRQEHYGSRSYYGQGGHIVTDEIYPPREGSIVTTEELGHGPGKENVGAITNIQSAISGFMKDVDPIPVVVVSGGMGALFLLFRYTPVGTFFRGGRRMNNRIPSRFSGQILGGFPGYEEFYDGGFGPGPINISYQAE
ncbi:hypothetical protein, conserved [Plasmodium vivax]|uniref:VIR protein n=1 Tax=Plasmodium vivax TaxID=5855 RepID=A0A1G4E5J6_PLAVI|nr:hypothetical protein, conserved [Plasmodium vivax]SCA60688.1 hypothetical protein, conserved [Plasmodium vivax]